MSDPQARRAEIQRQLARACPNPLSPDQLEQAADYVEAHPEAVSVLAPFILEDEGARLCRNAPQNPPQ